MATLNQARANRLHAQKCTGPSSTEGKARSSWNALKSGIQAESDAGASGELGRLQHRMDANNRAFHRDLDQLRLLKAARPPFETPGPPEPANPPSPAPDPWPPPFSPRPLLYP